MELFGIKDPEGQRFEVTKTKLAKLISQGWKLENPEEVLIAPAPVDTTALETADVPVTITAVEDEVDEPHAAKNEDKADDSDAKASSKKAK